LDDKTIPAGRQRDLKACGKPTDAKHFGHGRFSSVEEVLP